MAGRSRGRNARPDAGHKARSCLRRTPLESGEYRVRYLAGEPLARGSVTDDEQLVTHAAADERARGEVTLKDMSSGEQQSLPRADVAQAVMRSFER